MPPQIAHYLESKAKVTPDIRARLRDTDFEAHQVLTALHVVALRYGRSDLGTNHPVGHRDRKQSGAWLTAKQAATELHVTDRCIQKWCSTGRLPAIKPGANWLINRNDVDIFKLSE